MHGDSRVTRGPALIDLLQTYRPASVSEADELPGPPGRGAGVRLHPAARRWPKEFLGEMAHILNALFSAPWWRSSPYASVIAAVLEVPGRACRRWRIPVEGMDEVWAEPKRSICSTDYAIIQASTSRNPAFCPFPRRAGL